VSFGGLFVWVWFFDGFFHARITRIFTDYTFGAGVAGLFGGRWLFEWFFLDRNYTNFHELVLD
jgi:hypothetical protein